MKYEIFFIGLLIFVVGAISFAIAPYTDCGNRAFLQTLRLEKITPPFFLTPLWRRVVAVFAMIIAAVFICVAIAS